MHGVVLHMHTSELMLNHKAGFACIQDLLLRAGRFEGKGGKGGGWVCV